MNISNIELSYMGRTCTFLQCRQLEANNDDIVIPMENLGACVYINAELEKFGFNEGQNYISEVIELIQDYPEKHNFILLAFIRHLGIVDVPDSITEVINCEDEDQKHSLTLSFLEELGLEY